MSIQVGDTITAPTASGDVITGVVTARYDTDVEGRPLTGGPSLLVRPIGDHERVVKLAAAESYEHG